VSGATEAKRFLEERIRAGDFPGASWAVGGPEGLRSEGAVGDAVTTPERRPATPDTLYDLASLTKPLATALLAVRLQSEGLLKLDDRLDRHLPEWRSGDARSGLTLLDLLTHRSGLPGWDPLYLHASDVAGRIERMRTIPMPRAPLLDVEYSCLNYILLGSASSGRSALPRSCSAPPPRCGRASPRPRRGTRASAIWPGPRGRPTMPGGAG